MLLEYMPQESKSQTPKLVQMKKKRLDRTPKLVALIISNFVPLILNIGMSIVGNKKPLQVKTKMVVLPITRSVAAMSKNVSLNAFDLDR